MRSRLLAGLLGMAWAVGLHAQPLPPGVQLGMGVDALRQAQPAAEPVRRPERLAGGLAGSWRLDHGQVAGVGGAQIFFFAAGQLRRVEFQVDAAGDAAFEQLLAWGRQQYGPERPAQDAVSRYAAWSSADTDIYLRLLTGARGGLSLVISARPPRDDRTL